MGKIDLRKLGDGLVVADGGWSTALHARGVPQGQPAELANLTHPHLVERLAGEYAESGAQILCTNTFAANRLMFERRKIQADWAEVSRAGVEISRKVADRAGLTVVGTIGPSGRILAVREAREEQLEQCFADQARVLVDAGAEALVLETFSELAEVLLVLRAVKAVTEVPVIACMSFDSGPQRTRSVMGTDAAQAAAALEAAGADLVGSNCGAGVAHALPAVVALLGHTTRPVWVKPNAGTPLLEDGRPVWRVTPEEFAGHLSPLIEAGVSVLGGCCGTGPEHVKRVAALARSRGRPQR